MVSGFVQNARTSCCTPMGSVQQSPIKRYVQWAAGKSVLDGLTLTGGAPSICSDAADANDDGLVDIADALFVFSYIFVEGSVLPDPGLDCGEDPLQVILVVRDRPGVLDPSRSPMPFARTRRMPFLLEVSL